MEFILKWLGKHSDRGGYIGGIEGATLAYAEIFVVPDANNQKN